MPNVLAEPQLVITPNTVVTSSLLLQWLHSQDPRLVAWASDFARRRHDDIVIQEMPAWLEEYVKLPAGRNSAELPSAQQRAAGSVLDTLILEKIEVPIATIRAIAEVFPAQAVILISRIPIEQSRETLSEWSMSKDGNRGAQVRVRIATMMLANDPESMRARESSLASRVVASSEEEMRVVVESRPAEHNGSAISIMCDEDLLDSNTSPGWPPIFTYDLVENDPASTTVTLITLNGDRIGFRRFEHIRPGTCGASEVEDLDATTRHRLLAYWLGVQVDHMSWQPVENFQIEWKNNPTYQQQLGEIVETQLDKLQATVDALHSRGVLTEGQTTTAMPKLVVTIQCKIKPCPLD
jgi:hypothetical protein